MPSRGRVARDHPGTEYYFASSGTTVSSSLSVQRRTVIDAADADARVRQQAVQVIDPGHGLAIERNDHVTFAQARFLSGTAGRDGNHDHASLLRQVVEAHQATMQRRGLGLDSDIAAANSSFLQQSSSHKLRGVDSDGEAQSLSAHDGRGVHADDLAIGGHQRASGVARVERSVGLDYVVDHPS